MGKIPFEENGELPKGENKHRYKKLILAIYVILVFRLGFLMNNAEDPDSLGRLRKIGDDVYYIGSIATMICAVVTAANIFDVPNKEQKGALRGGEILYEYCPSALQEELRRKSLKRKKTVKKCRAVYVLVLFGILYQLTYCSGNGRTELYYFNFTLLLGRWVLLLLLINWYIFYINDPYVKYTKREKKKAWRQEFKEQLERAKLASTPVAAVYLGSVTPEYKKYPRFFLGDSFGSLVNTNAKYRAFLVTYRDGHKSEEIVKIGSYKYSLFMSLLV